MTFPDLDLTPAMWVLGTSVLCVLALRLVDAIAYLHLRRKSLKIVERALAQREKD